MNNYPLTQLERRIFSLIPESGEEVTSDFLAAKLYKERKPKYPRVVVMGSVNAIAGRNINGFVVRRSKRSGQNPVKIWKEKVQ